MNLRLFPALLLVLLFAVLLLLLLSRNSSIPTGQHRGETSRSAERRAERARSREWQPGEPTRPSHRESEGGWQNHDRRRDDQASPACEALGVTCQAQYFATWEEPAPGSCATQSREGYPAPDPRCTPGGIDPSVTVETLRSPDWRTRCLRNCQTSEAEKHVTYNWYGIPRPHGNSGENQVCELDHLVPLELGGADGLGNIWPECGPDATTLEERYFKVKDRVENYLAEEARSGRMPLSTAQHAIAADWPRYLPEANRYCADAERCNTEDVR